VQQLFQADKAMSRKSVWEVLEKEHLALLAVYLAGFILAGPALALLFTAAHVTLCCYKN